MASPRKTFNDPDSQPARATQRAEDLARASFDEGIRVKQGLAAEVHAIAAAGLQLAAAFRSGHKALLFGNGGSAADAQHIAAEWVGRFGADRPALPALALAANSSDLTSISNDYGFDRIFVREIEAHGREGDVAIAISTSGDSPNVIEGLRTARAHGLFCIALSGQGGGKMAEFADLLLKAPSVQTPRIQEAHIAIGHVLCEIVEAELFGDPPPA